MAVLSGIDEAGYGPLLGPLTVSCVSFSIPDELLKSDLWQVLNRAVARQKKHLGGRLLITDSKKAYSKSIGTVNLRRAVLASLSCLGENPKTAGDLINIICPDSCNRLADYPWYKNLSQKDLGSNDDSLEIASVVLENTLTAQKMRFLNMSTQCLDVGYYNQRVSVVKNKARVLFTAIAKLIKGVLESAYDSDNIQIIVDRQSGRTNYTRLLGLMFPELELTVIRQDKSICSYELCGFGKTMRVHFALKADDNYLPVSLASMTSKYVRQLLVESINHYFIKNCAHLKPTAGYWKDGLRFIKDLEKNLSDLNYEKEKLIRSR